MTEKDQPPEAIWLNDEAINEHFDRVKARYGAGATDDKDDDDEVPLSQNEMTRNLKKG